MSLLEIDLKKYEKYYDVILYDETKDSTIDKTIQMAFSHNKKLKNIFFFKSSNPAGVIVLEKNLLKKLKNYPVQTEIIKDFTLEELADTLSKLPKDSAVFYTIQS